MIRCGNPPRIPVHPKTDEEEGGDAGLNGWPVPLLIPPTWNQTAIQ